MNQGNQLTRSQFFLGIASKNIINSFIIHAESEPMVYGFMFIRIINMNHSIEYIFPGVVILISKYDFASVILRESKMKWYYSWLNHPGAETSFPIKKSISTD